jgi:hypothetical protein
VSLSGEGRDTITRQGGATTAIMPRGATTTSGAGPTTAIVGRVPACIAGLADHVDIGTIGASRIGAMVLTTEDACVIIGADHGRVRTLSELGSLTEAEDLCCATSET